MAGEPNTTAQNGNNGGQNLLAAGFMLGAVLLYSFAPVAIVLGGGPESPFLFNAVWRLGVAAGILLILLSFYRSVLLNVKVLTSVRRNIKSWFLLLALLNAVEYALFSLSSDFVDVAISAVLFELWPLFFIPLAAWLLREGGRYRKNLRSALSLGAVALAGLVFVVSSQTGGFNLENTSRPDLIFGVGLALAAAASAACIAFTLRWGKDFADRLPVNVASKDSTLPLSLFGAVVVSTVGAVLNAGIGVTLGEKVASDLPTYLGYGLLGGVLTQAVAALLLRKANLTTDNLGVNALAYLTPILSLAWLWLFSEIAVASVPYLVIGTAAIVAANLLINFEAERLLGFKALVIFLWACGTVAYLRDQFDWWAAWVAKSGGYFDVLVVSATVFALILSFRTARLSERIQEEDNRGFALFEELAELERQGVINSESRISEYVLTINRREGRELAAAYGQVHRVLNAALAQAQGAARERLVAAVVELNRLAHSRQRGTNFGEICALFLLAGMVVGIALLSRPAEVSGLTGFLVEMFAMLFPAVILFLGFNVLDLDRERNSRILEPDPEKGGYRAAFGATASSGPAAESSNRRTVEQRISIVIGGALIVAYAGLFLHKWGLWEQIMAAAAGVFS